MGLRKGALSARNGLYRALMRAFGAAIPVKKHRVAFESFGGHAYSDNPRAVCEALLALDPEAEPVFFFKEPKKTRPEMPPRVKAVRIHSLRAVWVMATAKAWVFNGLMPRYAVKRPNQFYVQTWHGDRMFKVCLQVSGKNGLPDVKVMDVGVIGSDQGEMFFRTAFRFEGELMRVGSPRDDLLMHETEETRARCRALIGLKPGEKAVMFAPTLREHLNHTSVRQEVNLDLPRVLDVLEACDGCPWRMIVRAHATMTGLTGVADDPRIVDLTDYEDMRDLLVATDLLISDYSSCVCDFPLTGRPSVLFQPDIEDYKREDRALYFEMSDSPYWAARTQDELEGFLRAMTPESIRENNEAILKFFGTDETGEASMRVARRIMLEQGK